MPFSGLSSNAYYTAGPLNGEDVARQIALLSTDEVPLLDWLGDSDAFGTNTVHEFLEEELRPNYITTSTAVASDTAAGGIQVADFGDLLTVGTLLENESANPEVMQVVSIAGASSIRVSRNFDSAGVGSLAAGQQLYVREPLALEGDDHPGRDVTRKRRRKQTYFSLFHLPVAISGTQLSSQVHGVGSGVSDMDRQVTMRLREAVRDLEKAVIRSKRVNSIGGTSTYRAMGGLREQIGSINSTVTASSFNANPHLYIGNVWEEAYKNGASDSEEWAIVAGRTYFRDISNLNDTKVQDSNATEQFKRVVRRYEGPFGMCSVFLTRHLPATSLLLIPKQRVKVVPFQGRSFHVQDIARTGDAEKKLIVGEYSVEIHHPQAMAQIKS